MENVTLLHTVSMSMIEIENVNWKTGRFSVDICAICLIRWIGRNLHFPDDGILYGRMMIMISIILVWRNGSQHSFNGSSPFLHRGSNDSAAVSSGLSATLCRPWVITSALLPLCVGYQRFPHDYWKIQTIFSLVDVRSNDPIHVFERPRFKTCFSSACLWYPGLYADEHTP